MAERRRFRFNEGNVSRPPNSKEILKNAFAKVDCLECGKCCRETEGRFELIVFSKDPRRRELLGIAKERRAKITQEKDGGFRVLGDDSCTFLDGNGCTIYESRPMICRFFPFMKQLFKVGYEDGKQAEEPKVHLTGLCPPLSEARDAGVAYVLPEDLKSVKKSKKRRIVKVEIPVLNASYNVLKYCISRGIDVEKNHIISMDKPEMFFIW